MWAAGRASGGWAEFGGPTWLRWLEMEEMDFKQIVGHTAGSSVRNDGWNLCIDTNLRHVLWIDDTNNKVAIEEV